MVVSVLSMSATATTAASRRGGLDTAAAYGASCGNGDDGSGGGEDNYGHRWTDELRKEMTLNTASVALPPNLTATTPEKNPTSNSNMDDFPIANSSESHFGDVSEFHFGDTPKL